MINTTRIVWLSDTHLNFIKSPDDQLFYDKIRQSDPTCVVITGDIAEAPSVEGAVDALAVAVKVPVYFVMGNHDYYDGSIQGVRERMTQHCGEVLTGPFGVPALGNSYWIQALDGPVHITDSVAMVGVDGWYDARHGRVGRDSPLMSDWFVISEFKGLGLQSVTKRMREIADSDAALAKQKLEKAFETHDTVIFITHVPPWKEASWHMGKISSDNWLPYFSSKVMGDTLKEVMRDHPDKRLYVLCGHSHSPGYMAKGNRIKCWTGKARYGHPDVAGIITVTGSEVEVNYKK